MHSPYPRSMSILKKKTLMGESVERAAKKQNKGFC